jgi:hypothetical protein
MTFLHHRYAHNDTSANGIGAVINSADVRCANGLTHKHTVH